jgi:acyl-CoA oxidase
MENPLEAVIESERLAPMLPLLYSAWLDGELESDELDALETELVSLDRLNQAEKAAISAWLDPTSPPSAQDLAELESYLRRVAPDLTVDSRPSELGLRLAGSIDDGVAALLGRADAAAGEFTAEASKRITGESEHPITLAPLPDHGPAPAHFDAFAGLLDGPHAEVRARMREILTRPEFTSSGNLTTDGYRRRVLEWTQTLAAEGVGALGHPETVGGGGDPGGFIAAFTELARHDISLLTKFGVQFGLFAGAVYRLGNERHHEEILPRALSGELLGCFAMSETGHGSNVADIETTVTYHPDTEEFEVHTPNDLARKDYIGNAARDGRMAVVFAQLSTGGLEHGVHALLVPLRSDSGEVLPGIRIEDNGPKGGLNGVDNGRIWFDRVRIPRTALLDRFSTVHPDGRYESSITSPARRFFTTLGTLVGGRVSVASASISAAEVTLAIAVRYATRRRQFGSTSDGETRLIDYPSHQRRLMPRLALTIGYHLACADLAEEYVRIETGDDAGGPRHRALEARAAGLKAFGTWHALDVMQECREACGGQGYLLENRIVRIRADADIFTTYEGDNTVLAQLVTKSLLTDFRSSFESMGLLRKAEFLRSRVSAAVAETIPRVGSVTGAIETHETQERLLERRERHVIETLASRIQRRIGEGMDPSSAFVSVQPHVMSAAKAHVERVVFDAFVRAEAQTPDAAGLIADLRTLACLAMAEDDLGWFLQHGVITPAMASGIRREVTERSAALASEARRMVDAFGIPDEVLAAPIAL